MKQNAKHAKDNEVKHKKKEEQELLQQKPETLLTSVIETKAIEAATKAVQSLTMERGAGVDVNMVAGQVPAPATSVTQFVQSMSGLQKRLIPRQGPGAQFPKE
jgi:hypothetical protein